MGVKAPRSSNARGKGMIDAGRGREDPRISPLDVSGEELRNVLCRGSRRLETPQRRRQETRRSISAAFKECRRGSAVGDPQELCSTYAHRQRDREEREENQNQKRAFEKKKFKIKIKCIIFIMRRDSVVFENELKSRASRTWTG